MYEKYHFPIVTERLVIRPYEENDYESYKALMHDENAAEGWKTMLHDIKGFLDWQISNYTEMDIVNGIVGLGIFEKSTGRILGSTGAGQHDDLGEPEIFYMILANEQGKGYATEAARAVTSWALGTYGISYIIGTAAVENIASQRVLEKCGYEYINERDLKVHILNKTFRFRYYRYYKHNQLPCSNQSQVNR